MNSFCPRDSYCLLVCLIFLSGEAWPSACLGHIGCQFLCVQAFQLSNWKPQKYDWTDVACMHLQLDMDYTQFAAWVLLTVASISGELSKSFFGCLWECFWILGEQYLVHPLLGCLWQSWGCSVLPKNIYYLLQLKPKKLCEKMFFFKVCLWSEVGSIGSWCSEPDRNFLKGILL